MEEVWVESERGQIDMAFMLHKGAIFKLIGKELTWDDEPVELI